MKITNNKNPYTNNPNPYNWKTEGLIVLTLINRRLETKIIVYNMINKRNNKIPGSN